MTKSIYSEVQRQRRLRHQSQAAIAAKLGTSQQIVSAIERGRGSLDQVVKLCKALGLPLSVRLGEREFTLVYPLDPAERVEIEANIDWLQRQEPAARLRTIAGHMRAALRLRGSSPHGTVPHGT